MDSLIAKKLVEVALQKDKSVRRRKADHQVIANLLIKLLRSGMQWKYLEPSNFSYHTVYKRFEVWKSHGVFEAAWKELLKLYSRKRLKENAEWFNTLFIDCSYIKNVAGRDLLGKNPSDRGRNAMKMSVICDRNSVPISTTFYPGNRNDSTTEKDSIEAIACKIRKRKNQIVTITGDKAYVGKTNRHGNSGVRMISPPKKNAKNSYRSDEDKIRLTERNKIEHVFCWQDKFRRLILQQEKTSKSYIAFNFIALSIIVANRLK